MAMTTLPPPVLPSTEEQARSRFNDDSEKLFNDPTFRRWFWYVVDSPDYCRTGSISSRSPIKGAPLLSADETFSNEGRRSVGVALVHTAQKLVPEMYVRMMTEVMGLRSQKPGHGPIVAVPSPKPV
jgi:hypothetical protein